MLTYLKYPERVTRLILVDPAVYAGGGSPAWVRPLLGTPQMNRLGPLFARQFRSRHQRFHRNRMARSRANSPPKL
jgi:pimeloyl-ACP methyl ester carboxylesterase